ncbi:hypothetical protein BN961_02307 [Afipia felis]|uniref:Uncharacterized protein n=1 Tax=Afipia felis TaxID=1035 RepID=A0A090MRT0_AFIFE|nr:hypothetical protein BN961_02307 [Afipia felis]
MDDAARGVRGLAANRKPAFKIAVERHAIAQKVINASRGFAGQPMSNCFIDDAAADGDGVARVRFRGVAFADGCGDAALRPHAGRAFAERGGRNDGDGTWSEFQCAEQARKPRADDDDMVGRLRPSGFLVAHAVCL